MKGIFEQAGHVVSFRLVYDRETGKPKGYGFCEYQDTETAQSALRNLNNHDFNGRPLRVGVAAGEGNKDEMQGMQQALGGPVLESPYGEAVEPEKAPEAISKAVASLPPEQMFELMKQMKLCIQNNPTEARNMLLQNPQLAYALLQAQIVMKIVDPQVAMAMLHRDSTQVPPASTTAAPTPVVPQQPPVVAQASQQQPPIMQQSAPAPATSVGMLGGPGPRFPMSAAQSMPGVPGPQQMAGGPGPQQNMMGGPPRGQMMGGQGMQGPMDPRTGPGGPMGGQQGPRGPMGGPGGNMGGLFGMPPGSMGQSPGQDFERDQPRDTRMMGDGMGMPFGGPGPRTGMPPASMAGPGLGNIPPSSMPGSAAGGMPRGGAPPQPAMGGFPSLAGLSNLGASLMAGGPISSQDQEKAALIMQVLQLTDQQIAMLPPDQRQSILILKEQISKSAQ